MMAGAHLTRSQWRTTENWNPGAVIDKFRRGREVVRDKGVTREGKKGTGQSNFRNRLGFRTAMHGAKPERMPRLQGLSQRGL